MRPPSSVRPRRRDREELAVLTSGSDAASGLHGHRLLNETLYKLGIAALGRLQSLETIAGPLDHFSKVWLRHRKLIQHLREARFDGVIDGGANVGEFARIVRAALRDVELLCVEPHPTCAETLRKSGFRVVEAALWKEQSRLRLAQPSAASTSSTVIPTDAESQQTWEVDAVRLDALPISGSRLLIKLDLQGAEFDALEGMGELWDRCAGLLVEVSIGEGGTYEPMRELLAARGFDEYSTTNELEVDGRVVEADKLWLARRTR